MSSTPPLNHFWEEKARLADLATYPSLTSFPCRRVTMTVWLVAAPSLFEIQAFEDSDADTKWKWQLSCLLTVCCCLRVARECCSGWQTQACFKMKAQINQIYGWKTKQAAFNMRRTKTCSKQNTWILYALVFYSTPNWSLAAENTFWIPWRWKKCVDKSNVRLCCVSRCFEAVLFLLRCWAQPGRCVLLLALCAIWLFVWLRCYLWRLRIQRVDPQLASDRHVTIDVCLVSGLLTSN